MKKVFTLVLFIFCTLTVFSKNPEEKTFLVIFDKAELKKNKTSTDYIELSLAHLFSTKAYSGNSDAAIMIKIPYTGIDKVQLGDLFVRVNADKVSPLSEIAVQIIDLGESKSTYTSLVTSYEERLAKTKKANKGLKVAPTP